MLCVCVCVYWATATENRGVSELLGGRVTAARATRRLRAGVKLGML